MDSCLNYYIFNRFPNLQLIPFHSILHITTRFIILKYGFSYTYQFESLEVIAKTIEAISVIKRQHNIVVYWLWNQTDMGWSLTLVP